MAKLYRQVVLYGDSLFQGSCAIQQGFSFQATLQDYCMRRYDVVNRGMSGYNTSQALKYLPEIFLGPGTNVPKIDYVILLLGANDAVIPMPTTNQGVSLDGYRENLKSIITHPIFKAHEAKILLVTPPPLDQIKTGPADVEWGHQAPIRESKRSLKYTEVCRELAAEMDGVVLIDLWRGIMDKAIEMCPEWQEKGIKDGPPYLGDPEAGLQGGLDQLLPDGLHMSGDAYRVFASLVLPHIRPEWTKLPPEDRSEYVLPDWQVAEWIEKDCPKPAN